MSPIPPKIREKLSNDPWMKSCCLCHTNQKIEWDHAIIYRGLQMQETYSIVPLCSDCHRGDFGTILKRNRDITELIAIERGLQSNLETKYPRRDWRQRIRELTRKIVLNK